MTGPLLWRREGFDLANKLKMKFVRPPLGGFGRPQPDLAVSFESPEQNKIAHRTVGYFILAEREGFEPSIPFRVNRLSKAAP